VMHLQFLRWCSWLWYSWLISSVQPLAGRLVEEMHERRVRFEPDPVAGIELVTLAEHGDHLFAAEIGEYLGFRTGRLDHDDLGLGAVIGDGEMLGPDAIDRRPSVGIGGRRFQRQGDTPRAPQSGAAAGLPFVPVA